MSVKCLACGRGSGNSSPPDSLTGKRVRSQRGGMRLHKVSSQTHSFLQFPFVIGT